MSNGNTGTLLAVVLGGIFFIGYLIPLFSITGVHVVIDRSQTTQYTIFNAWIEDSRETFYSKATGKNVESFYYINVALFNITEVRGREERNLVWEKQRGLKSPYGEHIIKWNSPINGTFTMVVSIYGGQEQLSSREFGVTYPIGGT